MNAPVNAPMNALVSESASAPAVVVVAPRHAVHWVIAGLLAIIATILLVRDGGPLGGLAALGQTGMLGARGIFAFTGQIDQTRHALWMLDVDAGTVWCYEYNPIKGKMRLVAARSFRYDRYLEEFNVDHPTPEEVEALLRQQRQAQNRANNIQQGLNSAMNTPPASQPATGQTTTGS